MKTKKFGRGLAAAFTIGALGLGEMLIAAPAQAASSPPRTGGDAG